MDCGRDGNGLLKAFRTAFDANFKAKVESYLSFKNQYSTKPDDDPYCGINSVEDAKNWVIRKIIFEKFNIAKQFEDICTQIIDNLHST